MSTAMIATPMPAAIKPYSTAVAPVSSLARHRINLSIGQPFGYSFSSRPSSRSLEDGKGMAVSVKLIPIVENIDIG
jgi:hypothetical protein